MKSKITMTNWQGMSGNECFSAKSSLLWCFYSLSQGTKWIEPISPNNAAAACKVAVPGKVTGLLTEAHH